MNNTVPSLREVEFGPTDQALREDVGRLGRLVGEVLVEQKGEGFLARVEAARKAAIQRRELNEPIATLAAQTKGLDAKTADTLSRAFATYFQVVNIAERVHRVRRRREYEIAGATPQPDGLLDVMQRLHGAGVSADELLGVLARLDIEPVFTAHPTEASRRALLEKEQDMLRALIDRLRGPQTLRESAVDLAVLRMALTASWQTADVARMRPTVVDEIEHVGFYLSDPIYRVLPVFLEALEDAVSTVFGICPELPSVLRFASWVGGDMDGNPNVNAQTIAATLRMQRDRLLRRYMTECKQLARALTQTLDRVDVDPVVLTRLAEYRAMLPAEAARSRPRHSNMPYRSLLRLMTDRLAATIADAAHGYREVTEFSADVDLIATSLRAHAGIHAGWFALRRLQRRIATFGFHLARLDVRQVSTTHSAALAEALGDLPADAAACEALLAPYANGDRTLASFTSGGTLAESGRDGSVFAATTAVFATLAEARRRYGDRALGVYVISMAAHPSDLLAVLALARVGGLVENGSVPLDIAPLFETIADLRAAPRTFAALLAHPDYSAHLAARGNRQTLMLGYSDSAKDGGILASRWALQRAQVELLEVARAAGVTVVFFHGRGGSVSRGGGKTSRAVMGAPRGAIDAHLRVTEQGEVIHQKYGLRALALRNFEQTTGAVIAATLRPRPIEPRESRWRETMSQLSADGEATYRALVTDRPDFNAYFRAATPIDVIERMTLSSRPARRGGKGGIATLRAIPWVFAWAQCRSNLPAWYGVGSALETACSRGGEDILREMARDWAFFRTLIEDLEMALAKSDLDISEQFSKLSGPLHANFFPELAAEFRLTATWLLRLRGNDTLLADDPRLSQSIRLRNPYVDPMSLIQADLLQRWRTAGRQDDALFTALASTVHGVVQALRNTG